MNAVDVQRLANRRLIDENSVSITIRREELVSAPDGGRVLQVSILPPFQARLVPSKVQKRKIQDEGGELQTSAWILIAPWNANINAGSGITDTFQAFERNFRISQVTPRKFAGQVYAVHAAVEEMK